MRSLDVDRFNINIIDVISVVSDCEIKIIKDLEQFDLIQSSTVNFRKQDVKTIFYFYILKYICDIIINSKSSNKCVFFYNKKCISKYNLAVFSSCDTSTWRFGEFILTFIKKLNNILPNLFYITDDTICFEQLNNHINSGECKDLLIDIKNELNNKSKKQFTFEKAHKFILKFGLTYLDKQYFHEVKIKSLLYK